VVRIEASQYITLFCSSTPDPTEQQQQQPLQLQQQRKHVVNLSRQIFIACGGLQSLISMLNLSGLDFEQHKRLVSIKSLMLAVLIVCYCPRSGQGLTALRWFLTLQPTRRMISADCSAKPVS
jgi:hypothetical protein